MSLASGHHYFQCIYLFILSFLFYFRFHYYHRFFFFYIHILKNASKAVDEIFEQKHGYKINKKTF